MKNKFLLIISACVSLLSACSITQPQPKVPLDPPQKTESGFVRVSPISYYYVDGESVWVDNEKKNLINFDTVIQLHNGEHLYPEKNLVTHSIREHKILNCDTGVMQHINRTYYSEFWGKGVAYVPKSQRQYSVSLQQGSSLGTIGQIICVNFYHR